MQVRPAALALIPVMVGLNLLLGSIVSLLKLPLYLDLVGIMLAGILAGPWIAAVVGVATCLVASLLVIPTLWAFSGTAFLIGITSALLARAGFYARTWKALLAGVIIALVAFGPSAYVSAKVFGGATGSGTDALTVFFVNLGLPMTKALLFRGLISEIADKSIAALLASFIARSLSRRTLQFFPGSESRLVPGQCTDRGTLSPSSKFALYVAVLFYDYSLVRLASVAIIAGALTAIVAALPGSSQRHLMRTFGSRALVFAASVFVVRLLIEILGTPEATRATLPAWEPARVAGREALRVVALILGAAVLMATTTARDVLLELEETRLPRSFRLVILTVVQYPKIATRRFQQVVEAQIARGGERPDTLPRKVRYGLSLLLPVVHAELNAVGDRAALIRTRGLDVEIGGESHWLRSRSGRDLLAWGMTATVLALAIWLRRHTP